MSGLIPFTPLLDAFIKLADRIINLENTRLQNREQFFKEIIQPLFEELEPVAVNYLDFFRQAKKSVVGTYQYFDEIERLDEMVSQFQERREAMLMARIKVRMMAKQINENVIDNEAVTFAKAIISFFSEAMEQNLDIPNTTRTEDFLDIFLQALHGTGGIMVIEKYIDDTLQGLERSWGLIVQSYQKLKISAVSSPELVHKRKTKKTKPK
jgi:hypothetical protein